MKSKESSAARTLAKRRWAGIPAAERSAHNSKIAQMPRSDLRCFCGEHSMWRAANRYFECCRKNGVVTVNVERMKELKRKMEVD